MTYKRFFAMIATSTIVMFGLMYLNTYLLSHVFWSETRLYMAALMGADMAIIMMAFMYSMYASKAVNMAIFVGAALVFGGALWLVRSQVTVGDTSYMRAMIPHHSIAIMTSTRANLSDPRVRRLADGIIYAQDKEIAEMRYLINEIEQSGDANAIPSPAPAEIVSLDQALSTPDITGLAPEFMSNENIARLFPNGPTCRFDYTPDSQPVLVAGSVDGQQTALFKISGDLVQLASDSDTSFGADGVRMIISSPDGGPLDASDEAVLTMELDTGSKNGYRGYYTCSG